MESLRRCGGHTRQCSRIQEAKTAWWDGESRVTYVMLDGSGRTRTPISMCASGCPEQVEARPALGGA